MDTAVYGMFGLNPDSVPLWSAARRRGLPGTTLDEITFPQALPGDFDLRGFVLPGALAPLTFAPLRLARGRVKSLYLRLTGGHGA